MNKNRSVLCVKLLMVHIKQNKKLNKSFNFTFHTQKYKLKDVLNEIVYVMKYNIPYRAIRSHIKWQTIYKVYRKLVDNKIFELTYLQLLKKYLKRGLNKKLKYVYTDTTFVMNKKGTQNIGLNKYYYKKKGNKISILMNSKKFIIDVQVYKGGKNDCKILEDQLEKCKNILNKKNNKQKNYFSCDAGYDSKNVKTKIQELGYIPVIEQNKRGIKNEKLIKQFNKREKRIYLKRAKIENIIERIKSIRRINLRYDKLMETFKGYVYFGIIYLMC